MSTDGLNKEGEERRCMAKKIDKYYDQGFAKKWVKVKTKRMIYYLPKPNIPLE